MQIGFAMLCAGSVRSKNTMNILLKNVMDACIGAIVWWLVGYGIAWGPYSGKGDNMLEPGEDMKKKPTKAAVEFIGHSLFGAHQLEKDAVRYAGYSGFCSYMFQYFFAATAATIVSGSVAERASFASYAGYAVLLTGWVYVSSRVL